MTTLTTKELFSQIIFYKDCQQRTKLAKSLVSQYRSFLNGKYDKINPSIEQMEKIIGLYGGYKVKNEKTWIKE